MNQYCFLFLLCALSITTVFANPIFAQGPTQAPKDLHVCGVSPEILEERAFGDIPTKIPSVEKLVTDLDAINDLISWSIFATDAHGVVTSPTVAPGEKWCQSPRWPMYIFLSRPRSKNFVAVVQSEPGSSTILNPQQGFNYGPIPQLKKMNLAEADSLWGQPSTENVMDQSRTYELNTASGNEVFLDVVFLENKLQKYRVRSASLRSNPSWCSVK